MLVIRNEYGNLNPKQYTYGWKCVNNFWPLLKAKVVIFECFHKQDELAKSYVQVCHLQNHAFRIKSNWPFAIS